MTVITKLREYSGLGSIICSKGLYHNACKDRNHFDRKALEKRGWRGEAGVCPGFSVWAEPTQGPPRLVPGPCVAAASPGTPDPSPSSAGY